MGGIELDPGVDQECWLRKGVFWSNYRKVLTKIIQNCKILHHLSHENCHFKGSWNDRDVPH